MDASRLMLGESVPRTVTAAGGLYALAGRITTPDILTAHFEFATCPLTWRHRLWGAEEYTPEVSNGVFLYGEKQTIFVTDDRWVVIPKGKNAERQVNKVEADAGKLHMAEFLSAVRSRESAGCPVEEGVQSTTTVKLAMIAYDTGRKIAWDAAAEQIVGDSGRPASSARLPLRGSIRIRADPWGQATVTAVPLTLTINMLPWAPTVS
jgi:hypothetical protein